MAWDTSELEALVAAAPTPFATTDTAERLLTRADPLAASRAFASPSVLDSEPRESTEELEGFDQRTTAEYDALWHAPGIAPEREPPYAAEEFDVPFNDVRQRAVKAATDERDRWHNGQLTEYTTGDGKETVAAALREYWSTVAAKPDIDNLIQSHTAWSAAFISTVMKRAGAGDTFRYTDAHYQYVAAAKQARLRNDATKLWAYRVTEAKPEPGDILCAERKPQGSNSCSGVTYDNVDDGTARASHGDVVVDVNADTIEVVGGNISDSVKQRPVHLDANGQVVQPNGCRYFALIKPPGGVVGTASPTAAIIKNVLDTLGGLPARVASAVHSGVISVEAGLALARGERDEGKLTNLLFAARHPELPAGYTIKATDRGLAQDWLRLRDTVVRPLLRHLGTSRP